MPRPSPRCPSPGSRLQILGVVLLACALIAPKLALSATLLFGSGYRSVVICSGTDLMRVVVSPDGDIVDEAGTSAGLPHCVLDDRDVVALQRCWSLTDYPRLLAVFEVPQAPLLPLPRVLGKAAFSRGPPRV